MDKQIKKRNRQSKYIKDDYPVPILSKEQAGLVMEKMKAMLGPDITNILSKSSLNANHLVRFMYTGRLCKNCREEKGLSINEVAQELHVPQYRIRAIEEICWGEIKSEVLDRYIEFLGLGKTFNEWLINNRDVYREMEK